MNLWVSMEDEGARTSDESAFNRSLAPLAVHLASWEHLVQHTNPIRRPDSKIRPACCWTRRYQSSASSSGSRHGRSWTSAGAKGIVTIGTATTPDEAAALEEAGVDAIVASGFEAGGHRGSFLRPAEDSLTGTFSLVPQVVDTVDVPVIAAGGIADARGVVAALALGAEGVQMGTVFLACEESGASRLHREALRGPDAGHTGLTRGLHRKAGARDPEPADAGAEPQGTESCLIHCNEDW